MIFKTFRSIDETIDSRYTSYDDNERFLIVNYVDIPLIKDNIQYYVVTRDYGYTEFIPADKGECVDGYCVNEFDLSKCVIVSSGKEHMNNIMYITLISAGNLKKLIEFYGKGEIESLLVIPECNGEMFYGKVIDKRLTKEKEIKNVKEEEFSIYNGNIFLTTFLFTFKYLYIPLLIVGGFFLIFLLLDMTDGKIPTDLFTNINVISCLSTSLLFYILYYFISLLGIAAYRDCN